jgi:GT2 family glycosyltransferase
MSKVLIQCVVVLYNCGFDRSRTLESLAEISSQESAFARQVDLLIYDNSETPQLSTLDRWKFGSVEYRHDARNNGLAGAYNYALSIARSKGVEWLLLLDQDTVVHSILFSALFAAITSRLPSKVSAIVPKLIQEGKVLSPQLVGRFRNHQCPLDFSGVHENKVTAFNSAACLKIKTVVAIGGFPSEYWLDYLDHIVFHRLQSAGGQVLILEAVVEHRLSLKRLETEMNLARYGNLLAAEWRFVQDTGSGGGTLVHRLRLLKRSLAYGLKMTNKVYALKTLHAALRQHH